MNVATGSGMRPASAVLAALSCVVGESVVGQFLSGDDPHGRLDELDETAITLPFSAWLVVGLIYYVLIAVVVYRLVRLIPDSAISLVSVAGVVVGNEVWNALLFGRESVAPAAIGMVVFAAMTIVAVVLVFRVDRTAGWVLLPYVVWVVGYDVPWILMVWQ